MATTQLPNRSILHPYLSSYAASGNPSSAQLPDGRTRALAGTGTNVNHLILQPDGTPISDLITAYSKTANGSATVNEDIAATVTRPLGGSGTATLAALSAVEFLLIADDETTAEREAGSIGSRTATVSITVATAASGGTDVFTATLSVTAVGQAARASYNVPASIGANATLIVSASLWAVKTKLHILTVAAS